MDAEGNCSLEVPDQSVQHILEQVLNRDKMIPVCRGKKSFTFPHRFQLFSETNALPLSQLKSQYDWTFSNVRSSNFSILWIQVLFKHSGGIYTRCYFCFSQLPKAQQTLLIAPGADEVTESQYRQWHRLSISSFLLVILLQIWLDKKTIWLWDELACLSKPIGLTVHPSHEPFRLLILGNYHNTIGSVNNAS